MKIPKYPMIKYKMRLSAGWILGKRAEIANIALAKTRAILDQTKCSETEEKPSA
jgi:hypothetical protein